MRKFRSRHLGAIVGGLAAVYMAGMSVSANAMAIIGLQVEGGGTQQVFALGNGNFLGLWGFDARESSVPGNAAPIAINSAADITQGFTSGGGNIVNYYYGSCSSSTAGACASYLGGNAEFDPLVFGFSIGDDVRLFDSLWIEWTGGNLVYADPDGGTKTMNSTNITRQGDPLAVPEPGTLALFGLGLAGLGFARRRRMM